MPSAAGKARDSDAGNVKDGNVRLLKLSVWGDRRPPIPPSVRSTSLVIFLAEFSHLSFVANFVHFLPEVCRTEAF